MQPCSQPSFRADGECSVLQAGVRNDCLTASTSKTCKLLYVFDLVLICGKLLEPMAE